MSDYVSLAEIAVNLGVSADTVRGWIRKGLYPAPTHTAGRRLLWLRSDVAGLDRPRFLSPVQPIGSTRALNPARGERR